MIGSITLGKFSPLHGGSRAWFATIARQGGGPRTRSGGILPSKEANDRSGKIKSRLGNLPSLKEFVHKTAVVRQYRDFLRAVVMIPDETFRQSALDEVRRTFRQHSFMTDKIAIDMEVADVSS